MIKLISIDLDGTLLDDDGKISQNSIYTLSELKKKGIYIVISTGRSKKGIPENIGSLNMIDYFITSNGTSIFDVKSQKVIYKNFISYKNAQSLIKKIDDKNVIIDCLIEGEWHMNFKNASMINEIIPNKKTVEYIINTRIKEKNIFDYLSNNKCDVEKIVVNIKESDISVKNKVLSAISETSNFKQWSDKKHKLDIYASSVSKCNALYWLSNKLNICCEEIMAFGNDFNDKELLEYVIESVAMKNSPKEIIDVCKYVANNNNDDGVAMFLNEFFKL